MLTELLLADQPPRDEDPKETTTGDNVLLELADGYGVGPGDRPSCRAVAAAASTLATR